MLRCWFGFHDIPVHARVSDTAIQWRCPRCEKVLGQSDYPASDTFERRQQVALVVRQQFEFQKRQAERRKKWTA